MKSKRVERMLLAIAVVVSFLVTAPLWTPFFGSTPPQPTIRYGEFPFRLEYEINGRIVVVEDTIICKYKGIGVNWGSSNDGKFLKWEGYLASNKPISNYISSPSLFIDDVNQIYFFLGSSVYYLGAEYNDGPHTFAFLFESSSSGKGGSTKFVSADELLDKYNIRIISFEPSPPIKNIFK